MNLHPSSLPASLSPPELLVGTLDERIASAESRLVAREQRLRDGSEALLQRLQKATEPRRLLWPVLGGVLAVGAIAWAWRRLGRPHRTGASALLAPAIQRGASSSRSDVPWVRAVALAWPLLPAHWRARVGPGTASLVAAVGLPLAEQLFKRAAPVPLPTVQHVDGLRFAGTWYEVAHLPSMFEPACAGLRSVTYTAQGAGFDVVQRCAHVDGQGRRDERVSQGTARVLPGRGGARFELSVLPAWLPVWLPVWLQDWLRGLPFARAEHCVLHLEPDYSVALLGSRQPDHLSILSRQPQMPTQAVSALIDRARELGFAVDRLRCSSAV